LFLLLFQLKKHLLKARKKKKADKESSAKWKLKVLTPKEPKPYKKLLIQLQLRKED
jgi:hypothetical protein